MEKKQNSNYKSRGKSYQYKNRRSNNSVYISVVIPLLDEEESIPELALQLEGELNQIAPDDYEVLFIDDGSTDKSYEIIRELNKRNKRFKAIRFRRNYGKSAALSIGFKNANGKIIITMDADLQDDPQELSKMVRKLEEGFDLVSGWKKERKDPFFTKKLPSRFYNFVTSKVSGIKLHDFNCGFKAYRREVAKSLEVYGEMHRYLPALAHWDGFKVTEMPVKHHARRYGKTKFGISRFLNGFLDLLTVTLTSKYSKSPLHFFGLFGILFTIIGFGINLYLTIEWALGMTYLSNRPLQLFGIALIIVGVQFISVGLIGELLIKNYAKNIKYNIKERLF